MAKRIIVAVLLAAVLLMSVLSGCSQSNERTEIISQIETPLPSNISAPSPLQHNISTKVEDNISIIPITRIVDNNISSALNINNTISLPSNDKFELILQIGAPLSPETLSPLPAQYDVPSKAEEYIRIAPVTNIINKNKLSALNINNTILFELFDGKEIKGQIVNIITRGETMIVFAKNVDVKIYNSISIVASNSDVSVIIDSPTGELDYATGKGKDGKLYLAEYEYGHIGAVE